VKLLRNEIFASQMWANLISYFALAKYFTKGTAFDFTASVSERFH